MRQRFLVDYSARFLIFSAALLGGFLFISFTPRASAQSIPTLPGTTSGTSSTFSITNSTYLDITVDSSQVITANIASVPHMNVSDLRIKEFCLLLFHPAIMPRRRLKIA